MLCANKVLWDREEVEKGAPCAPVFQEGGGRVEGVEKC